MKTPISGVAAVLFFFLSSCSLLPEWISDKPDQSYYIDAVNGNDSYSGRSPDRAWGTLDRINQTVFEPGDKLYFKAGTVYTGQLKPQGSGTATSPIIIDKYGTGQKPLIAGEGEYEAAVYLYNIEYWEINNLEITNTGPEREAGRRGVIIGAYDFGDCRHIHLNKLDIHDVNGSLVKSEGEGSAIMWYNGGDSIKTRFVDLRIENCHLYRCERNGITGWGYVNRDKWHPSLQVVIRNNLLEQIPGDGIVPIGCEGALVEHNVMRDCPDILPQGEAAAGIWPWSSDHTIIQYNEVSDHNSPWDGQGFDADWNCRNTVIQYNYSHDNAGGFLLVCNKGDNIGTPWNSGTTGTVVRYNISVNDGLRRRATPDKGYFSPTFNITGPCKDTRIYNNVIYIPEKPGHEIDRTIVAMDNWGGPWPKDTYFANNVFFAEGQADFYWGKAQNTAFSHNLFSGEFEHLPVDTAALFSDPYFTNPDAAATGFESLSGFMPQAHSPCIQAGVYIADDPVLDFSGNPVPVQTSPSIGAFEWLNSSAISPKPERQ